MWRTCVWGATEEGHLTGAGHLDAYALQRLQEVFKAVWPWCVGYPVCHAPVPDGHYACCRLELLGGES